MWVAVCLYPILFFFVSLYVIYVDFFASPLDLKEDLVVSPGSPQSCPIQLVMLRVCRKDPKGIPHFEINLCTVPHIIGCIRMFFAVYHRFCLTHSTIYSHHDWWYPRQTPDFIIYNHIHIYMIIYICICNHPYEPPWNPIVPHVFLGLHPISVVLFPIPIRPVALALLHAWPWTWESGDQATTVIRNGNPMKKKHCSLPL